MIRSTCCAKADAATGLNIEDPGAGDLSSPVRFPPVEGDMATERMPLVRDIQELLECLMNNLLKGSGQQLDQFAGRE